MRQDPMSTDPDWLCRFIDDLRRADLSAATVRGYGYDLRHFLRWHEATTQHPVVIDRLNEFDLTAYRQVLIVAGKRPATVNRRLAALRRLCRWAQGSGAMGTDIARDLRRTREPRRLQPRGLLDPEIHGLLRAAGASSHGHARRNYALAQLMIQ